MLKLIKSEFIKNRMGLIITLVVLFTSAVSIFITRNISNLIEGYFEGNWDAYIYILLCQVQLLLCFPFILLLVNSWSSLIEEKDNGWGLIVSNVKSIPNAIRAKYFTNIIIAMFSYLVITIAGTSLLWERGTETVVKAVLVPMLFSFICFIPYALLIQTICILINNIIGKIFVGIFIIMASFIAAQTKLSNYIFTDFPYNIATKFDFVKEQLLVSIILIFFAFIVGVRIIELKLRKVDF